MGEFSIETVDDLKLWNEFVLNSPQVNPFQLSDWLEVMADVFNFDFVVLILPA